MNPVVELSQLLKMRTEEIDFYKKAGEIAKQVVEYAKSFVKRGMLLIDIANKIDDKIEELGAEPAFPVNLSLNEIAAHYTPSKDDETKAEGLLKIDLGVAVDGCIADVAFSVDLSESGEFKKMIELNEKVLNGALESLKIDSEVKDVGEIIESEIEGSGFNIVRNLSGHSVDKNLIHAGLTIPNHRNKNNVSLNGMAFAVEPFLTTGIGEIYEGKPSEIFRLESDKQVRDKDAREILNFIKEKYETRPFCRRWLERKGFKKIGFVLSLLVKEGVLHNYPVLVEKSRKPVSQAEHTVIIHGEVEVTTR